MIRRDWGGSAAFLGRGMGARIWGIPDERLAQKCRAIDFLD